MNRELLFKELRDMPFGGHLTQDNVEGVNQILDSFDRNYPEAPVSWKANVLAQVFHETGGRMEPVRETFADSDREAIRRLDKAFENGQLSWVSRPYWREGYFGRGYIQLTHHENYRKMGDRLGVQLADKPSNALDPKIAADIAVVGMVEGLFTGVSLKDFFSKDGKKNSVRSARKIVNGLESADKVAKYHAQFLPALKAALGDPVDTKPTKEEAADEEPIYWSKKFWSLVSGFVTGVAGLVGSIANPWAFAALALLVLVGVGTLWFFLSGKVNLKR